MAYSNPEHTGERCSYLSSVPARMYLPLGENLTNETGGFSSSEGRKERGRDSLEGNTDTRTEPSQSLSQT